MFSLRIENSQHNVITLTQDESKYQVIDIDGLNPPKAQLNRSTVAGMDGTKFNSSKLEERNIVITLKINGDVEYNRLFLYQYLRTKEWCKVYYKNGSRDVYIEGYIETMESNYFTNNEQLQISIICPNPFFRDVQEIVNDISKAISNFEFPFSFGDGNNTDDPIEFGVVNSDKLTNVYNKSENETGVIIEINFGDSVKQLKIVGVTSGENFTLNYNFLENDTVIINTNKGEKSVRLIRAGAYYNLFTYMQKGSSFFQLGIGDNYFSYLADNGISDDSVEIQFKFNNVYRGV